MLTERIYCDLHDVDIKQEQKCIGCPFRLESKDQSVLAPVHAVASQSKKKRVVEVWQSVAASLSGIVQVVK